MTTSPNERESDPSATPIEFPTSGTTDSSPSAAPQPRRGRPRKTEAEKLAEKTGGKKDLSDRQRRILEVIQDSTVLRGYPPSIREIADAVGLHSTSSVSYHLTQLESKGYLRREDKKPRAFDVRSYKGSSQDPAARPKPGRKSTKDEVLPDGTFKPEATYVPVVGEIAAGNPILAEQHVEAHFPLPEEVVGTGELFLLQVVGESMRDAGILNGDWVVVRSQSVAEFGDFVAAMIDGEATVKEFQKDSEGLWLIPHNEFFEPIPAENAQILGKVTAVLRKV